MGGKKTGESIAAKYNLNAEQRQVLGSETTLVLLSIIHIDEYKAMLYKELALVGKVTIDKIFSDLEELVIKDIKLELMYAFETNNKEENTAEKKVELEKIKSATNITPKVEDNTHEVLKSHGIEILHDSPLGGNKLPVPEKLEIKGEVNPLVAQKLSSAFQIPKVETDHSLENITKNTSTTSGEATKSYKVDPYREMPE